MSSSRAPSGSNAELLFRYRLQQHDEDELKVLSDAIDRVMVELGGNAYLILIPGAGVELTPRRISNRISKWPRLKGRQIKGHVVLSKDADLSARVISEDGRNLPPRVAVVGKWGSINRLAVSQIDPQMAYLLELAG